MDDPYKETNENVLYLKAIEADSNAFKADFPQVIMSFLEWHGFLFDFKFILFIKKPTYIYGVHLLQKYFIFLCNDISCM